MTLEVRQLLLRATVDEEDEDDEHDTGGRARARKTAGCGEEGDGCEDREQLKEEILAECRTWLLVHLEQLRER